MTPERWQRLKKVTLAALELKEEELSAFLDNECGDDRELRDSVERLLAEDRQPGGSAERAIAAAAAQIRRSPGGESMPGRTISHYKITGKLGEGGMGVVYKAEDSKLRRTVALKFPPLDKLAAEEAKARFVREAQAAAALNDPNICTVYEIDEADGRTFIAMEFVAGQNVKDKVREGALPFDEALDIAVQAARALGTAHGEGIVHRDIKSANLMLTSQGQVKVMDFGLAQVGDRSQLTMSGTTLGTPAYMSPEQTQAQPTDRRTDIWSLGVVLYEMLTGRLPFHGEILAAVTYAVVNTEPEPPTATRSGLPAELDQVIAKALAKDPDERYQHVDEMLEDLRVLEGQIEARSSSTKPSKKPSTSARREALARTRRRRWAWALGMAAAAAVVTIAGLSVGNFLPTAEAPLEPLRTVPLTTYPGFEGNPSFSPDGNQVAFSWNEQRDNWDIYVQLIGLGDPLRLTTDPASDLSPAWSPDGQHIAFLRGTPARGTAEVFLVPALGGQERKLAETPVLGVRTLGTCLNWSPDSRWLAVCDADDSDSVLSLFLLSVDSGEKRRLTSPPEGSMGGDFSPAFSPDGRMLAFTRFVTGLFSDLYLLDLGDDLIPRGEPRRRTFTERTTTSPVFTPDGRDIIFAAGMIDAPSLWRVPASGAAPPERLSIGERALFPAISRRGNRAAYENVNVLEGDIWRADLPMTEGGPIKLNSSSRDDIDPRYSPDGKSIAFVSSRAGSLEIWKCDSDGSNAVQLTSLGASITAQPRWVPDGNSIGFLSDAEGQFDVYVVNADGGAPRRLTSGEFSSWSRDGKWIYFSSSSQGDRKIFRMPAAGGAPVPVVAAGDGRTMESPDGKLFYFIRGVTSLSLWKVPVEGGEESQVIKSLRMGLYEVVEDGIYFIPEVTPGAWFSIQFLRFATGAVEHVLDFEGIPTSGLSVSPDGRSILYTQMDPVEIDLMLVENFRSGFGVVRLARSPGPSPARRRFELDQEPRRGAGIVAQGDQPWVRVAQRNKPCKGAGTRLLSFPRKWSGPLWRGQESRDGSRLTEKG